MKLHIFNGLVYKEANMSVFVLFYSSLCSHICRSKYVFIYRLSLFSYTRRQTCLFYVRYFTVLVYEEANMFAFICRFSLLSYTRKQTWLFYVRVFTISVNVEAIYFAFIYNCSLTIFMITRRPAILYENMPCNILQYFTAVKMIVFR